MPLTFTSFPWPNNHPHHVQSQFAFNGVGDMNLFVGLWYNLKLFVLETFYRSAMCSCLTVSFTHPTFPPHQGYRGKLLSPPSLISLSVFKIIDPTENLGGNIKYWVIQEVVFIQADPESYPQQRTFPLIYWMLLTSAWRLAPILYAQVRLAARYGISDF